MRISIVGGGIGGCAAALALHQAGHDVVVHEAHPTLATDAGAFLTLADNGLSALETLGAAEIVRTVGFRLDSLAVADLVRPLPDYQCLRWGELVAALQGEVRRRGIPLRHGERITTLDTDADVLIGADGVNSAVRQLIDPTAAPRRYAGQRVFYGYSHGATGTPGRITMVRETGAAFGYAVSPSQEIYWFARVNDTELAPGETPTLDWQERLGSPAREIVGDCLATNSYDLPDVTIWHRGRALLIGDAAHAASPATGQGASLAIEDAVVLADVLTDDLESSFRRYETTRRPRVAANIEASARMAARR